MVLVQTQTTLICFYLIQDNFRCYVFWCTTERPRFPSKSNLFSESKIDLKNGENIDEKHEAIIQKENTLSSSRQNVGSRTRRKAAIKPLARKHISITASNYRKCRCLVNISNHFEL